MLRERGTWRIHRGKVQYYQCAQYWGGGFVMQNRVNRSPARRGFGGYIQEFEFFLRVIGSH